jgi:aminopeptidase N
VIVGISVWNPKAGLCYFCGVISAWPVLLAATTKAAVAPGPGISEELANDRAAMISALHYDLEFQIPESKSEAVRGRETIRFTLRAPHPIVLDFDQPRNRVLGLSVAGQKVEFQFSSGHFIVPASATRAGENAIDVQFIAGDEALNRSDDFLYTLFVPARAHLTFPCFDQPNLKARFKLVLTVPDNWQAVSNGAELRRTPGSAGAVEHSIDFAESRPLPTYLFAFAAGKFSVETAERNGRTFRMFHRETDAAKVARNREALFDLHARALAWLEDYTGIPYPWGKFDFVLIPSFQFGGMEHPGAIFYNASSLLLDASATQNQLLNRAATIAHETSHMWFGDLVTMRWFNDVWMKEVLANFMAAKIVNPSFPEVNHALRFLLEYYPPAYDVDRTAGANPIRQQLANLNEAGTLYGNIIYDKAPIAMRQLEMIVGETGFRDGLRQYLKNYSYGNATWLDLVQTFEARHRGIAAWSHAWVELRGRPQFSANMRFGQDGRISELLLEQHDPLGRGTVWPEQLDLVLGFAGRVQHIPVLIDGAATRVREARGNERPQYVLANGGGVGYGLFLLDNDTLRYLLNHLEEISDPLVRGSAWVDLWENLLEAAGRGRQEKDARITPGAFLDLASRALPRETDIQNTERILGDVSHAFWQFLPSQERSSRAPALESLLRAGIARGKTPTEKSAYFNTFRDIALTPEGLAWLERLWKREEKIDGLPFAESDEINMALELAVRAVPGWAQVLETEHDRIANPDRKARFAFVMPALSADPEIRRQAFERLRNVENRRHEAWVLESLRYLNHPLRADDARGFIQPSLELLPEIQRTGDIFFPKRWMDATLWGQRSPAAASIVRDFLARNPHLPRRLQWIVLSSSDDLFRASRMP